MEATDTSRLVCVVVVSYQEYSLTRRAQSAHPSTAAVAASGRARSSFVMAVQGEFPRARGAGVPKGTILCLGRVLDAHDEQDDAEGGRRDWEEDPLGFDTNPMLLRAMCMAFE